MKGAIEQYMEHMGDPCDHHRDECPDNCPKLGVKAESELAALRAELAKIRALVAEQAEDAGLWFNPHTAPEAYQQQELRRLHALIEGRSQEECARDAIKRSAP